MPLLKIFLLSLALTFALPFSALAAASETIIGPSGLPVPRFVALKADRTNGRVGPSFDYPVQYELHRKDLPLKVIAETPDNQWRKVEDSEGVKMWIHRTQLVQAENVMVQADSAVALRAKARYNAGIRALLEPGVLARLETCEPEWCRVKAGNFRGWLPRQSLWGIDP